MNAPIAKCSSDGGLVFLADGPPLRQIGSGNHSIGWYLVSALAGAVSVVVTHRYVRSLNPRQIVEDLPVPAVLYPDLSVFGLGRVLGRSVHVLDFIVFVLSLPLTAMRLKRFQWDSIFALAGANIHFLPVIYLLARILRCPYDVYLVDDLEASARLAGRKIAAGISPWVEGFVLRRAKRVFCISDGYCRHLAAKYGITTFLLPVCAPGCEAIAYAPAPTGPTREIVFCGSVNNLYIDGLNDLESAISVWNSDPARPFEIVLHLITMQTPDALLARWGNPKHVKVSVRLQRNALLGVMANSWVTFLPYSFSESERVMVQTSFSCKMLDSLRSGRPILVYGPPEASLPQWFRDHGLGVVVTVEGQEAILAGLEKLACIPGESLVKGYARLGAEEHAYAGARHRIVGDSINSHLVPMQE